MAIQKVLMVDDEPDIRKVGILSLKGVGRWKVFSASSGPEAIGLASRELPDLILLDVMMPGMDGPATLATLKAQETTATIPVIFMTAKVQKCEIQQFLKLGALGVICKPFDPMTLPVEIKRIFSQHEASLAAPDAAS